MKAMLYLERINQEMIRAHDRVQIAQAIDGELERLPKSPEWGGNVWDKSCCIINIHKVDPDIAQLDKLGQSMVMRREAFGGLVWVRKTNAVYQVDEQAFMALVALDGGQSLGEAAESVGTTEESVRQLIAQLAAPTSGLRSAI